MSFFLITPGAREVEDTIHVPAVLVPAPDLNLSNLLVVVTAHKDSLLLIHRDGNITLLSYPIVLIPVYWTRGGED